MILPTKHIRFSESLLGLGGALLDILDEPMSIDEVWFEFSKINNKSYPAYQSYDNVVLALHYLFAIGTIGVDKQGRIINATS